MKRMFGYGQTRSPLRPFSLFLLLAIMPSRFALGLASIVVDVVFTATPAKTSPDIISLPAAPLRLGFYRLPPLTRPSNPNHK